MGNGRHRFLEAEGSRLMGSELKGIIKAIANGLAVLLVLPCVLAYRLGSLLLGPGKGFPGWSQALGLVPGLCGVYLRRRVYPLGVARCGPGGSPHPPAPRPPTPPRSRRPLC